jgi:hypothetical protein
MKNDWHQIKNYSEFVEHTRLLVFKLFGEESDDNPISNIIDMSMPLNTKDKEEMDKMLSYEESSVIVNSFARHKINKKTKETAYFITQQILMDIVESLNSRLVSNILNKLVNDGILESAYDSEKQDFIFWMPENHENKKDKPEAG